MSLVPPTELQEILGERPLAPLSDEETRRVSELVTRGFESWQSFHQRFSSEERQIRMLDPGAAGWPDVASFVQRHLRAEPAEGLEALTFGWSDGEAVESSATAPGLRLQDGRVFACGEFAGMPVTGPDGARVGLLGLNHPESRQGPAAHRVPCRHNRDRASSMVGRPATAARDGSAPLCGLDHGVDDAPLAAPCVSRRNAAGWAPRRLRRR